MQTESEGSTGWNINIDTISQQQDGEALLVACLHTECIHHLCAEPFKTGTHSDDRTARYKTDLRTRTRLCNFPIYTKSQVCATVVRIQGSLDYH